MTGEVIEVLPPFAPELPENARIRFTHRGKEVAVLYCPETDEEGNQLALGYRLGDPVHLLVPTGSPREATPARSVRNDLYGGSAVFGTLGAASLGFGLLLLTGSLAISR